MISGLINELEFTIYFSRLREKRTGLKLDGVEIELLRVGLDLMLSSLDLR